MEVIHKRIRRNTRIAGAVFATLTVILLALSYLTNFIVFEIDSIVAFVAAIVVLATEQGSSVQARIVWKLINSYEDVIRALSGESIVRLNQYVQRGQSIGDIVVVSSDISSQNIEVGTKPLGDSVIHEGFPPLGRNLAELVLRELGMNKPNLDDILGGLSVIAIDRLHLATAVHVERKIDSSGKLEIVMTGPSLQTYKTYPGAKSGDTFLSPIGSILAVLVCFASRKDVVLEKSEYDPSQDSLFVSLHFVEEREASGKGE